MSSNNQSSNFVNFQTAITTNHTSQSNLAESSTATQINVPYVEYTNIYSSNQHYGNQETYSTMIEPQQTFQLTLPIQPVHSSEFFYRPPNDSCNYHIECREISLDLVIQLLNEFNGNFVSN